MQYLFGSVIQRLRAKVRECEAANRNEAKSDEVPMVVEEDSQALTSVHVTPFWSLRPFPMLHALTSIVRRLLTQLNTTPSVPLIKYHPMSSEQTAINGCSQRKRLRETCDGAAEGSSEEREGAARSELDLEPQLLKGRRLEDGRSEFRIARISADCPQALPDRTPGGRKRRRDEV